MKENIKTISISKINKLFCFNGIELLSFNVKINNNKKFWVIDSKKELEKFKIKIKQNYGK